MIEEQKKRGRPPKDKEKQEITLREAIQNGMAFLREDVDLMVREEVEKAREKITEEIKSELACQRADQMNKARESCVADFMTKSGLTDKSFCMKLMGLGITAEMSSVLRNDHSVLDRRQIWQLIRENYKPKKKK